MRAAVPAGGVALGEGGGEREPRAAPAGADGAFLGPREQRAGVPGEGRERRNQPGVERVLGERDDEHADDTARDGDRADERAVQPELAGAGGQAGATRREAAEQRGQREVQERAGARERARLEDVEQRRQRALAEVEQQRGVRAGGRGDAGGAGPRRAAGSTSGEPAIRRRAVGDVHERALGIGRERAARDGVDQLATRSSARGILAPRDRDERQRRRCWRPARADRSRSWSRRGSRRGAWIAASAPSRALPSSTGAAATLAADQQAQLPRSARSPDAEGAGSEQDLGQQRVARDEPLVGALAVAVDDQRVHRVVVVLAAQPEDVAARGDEPGEGGEREPRKHPVVVDRRRRPPGARPVPRA